MTRNRTFRATPDCPDHFVGAEHLICLSCGWDAAVNRYTSTIQLERIDTRRRRAQYERYADRLQGATR